MFDWPATSQTSPTRMSFNSIVFFPRMVIVAGVALARMGSSLTSHLPSADAVDAFARIGLAPDRNFLILLEHHAVTKDVGHRDVCASSARYGKKCDDAERKFENWFHWITTTPADYFPTALPFAER